MKNKNSKEKDSASPSTEKRKLEVTIDGLLMKFK